ncbi:MAG: ABC transporter ATP-binding protein [Lachnospiraceae bacterium]|nr:ABC transporter ATP-binding protein [Lachnospiraceae bacterium]
MNRKTLQYFFPIAWRFQKSYFFIGITKAILEAVNPFVSILFLPLIIDELLGERDLTRIFSYVAIIAVAGSLISMFASILGCQMEKCDEKFQNYFTEMMSRRVMELDFQLTEDKEALDQIELARTGMDWYSGGVHGIFMQVLNMFSALLRVVGVIVLIAMHAPVLFILVIITLLINMYLSHKDNQLEIRFHKELSKVNRVFGYSGYELMDIRYAKDIRLYDAQDMMVTKWERYTDESLKYWKAEGDGFIPTQCVREVTTVVRDFCMYLYLGMLVIKGNITIGIFSQMISACRELTNSVVSISNCMQELTKRCNYAYEYVKFMHYPAAIEKGSRPVTSGEHVIEFRDVSFAYPKTEVRVLEHVNLKLKAGEHLSVVGLNGAGKTTFVKLLCRLYDPTEGEILLDNVNIKEYDYEQYMNLFSPVFQDFKLFAFSIRENILMGEEEKDHTNEALHALFEQVGFSDKLASLENGMDTMLFKSFDKEGIEASGGEQQKLAIARALYKHAPVVILDEPTAALDPIAEYEIYRQFHSLVGGKTAIYISHRLSSCRFCDHIAVFSDGHVAEYGTHDTLVGKENGIYAEMFAAQAQYYQ